jgi:hypothetical protein
MTAITAGTMDAFARIMDHRDEQPPVTLDLHAADIDGSGFLTQDEFVNYAVSQGMTQEQAMGMYKTMLASYNKSLPEGAPQSNQIPVTMGLPSK